MVLLLLFALLQSTAFGCMKVEPGNGGIPAGCPVFDAWSNEDCGAVLGGMCIAAIRSSTSVTCPTAPYKKIYMKGSREAKAYQSVECDARSKSWKFVDLAGYSTTQAEVEAVYGPPLTFACVGR